MLVAVEIHGAARAWLALKKGTRFGGSMYLSNGIVWSFARAEDVRSRPRKGDVAMQDLGEEHLIERPWQAGEGPMVAMPTGC